MQVRLLPMAGNTITKYWQDIYQILVGFLLRVNLAQQAVGMTPTVHHIEHVAYVNTDAASQFRVEEDVA